MTDYSGDYRDACAAVDEVSDQIAKMEGSDHREHPDIDEQVWELTERKRSLRAEADRLYAGWQEAQRKEKGLRHPLRLSDAEKDKLNRISERAAEKLDPTSDAHEYVWGWRNPRPDEEHLNRVDDVKASQPDWDRKLTATGHTMTWDLRNAEPGSEYNCSYHGRCTGCGATMSIGYGGTTIGKGSARCARDVPCRGQGTAWQDEMEHELQVKRFTGAVGQFGQDVKDAHDRAWLHEQGLLDDAAATPTALSLVDGESCPVTKTWPDGAFGCPFCESPCPAGGTGCTNPGCRVNMTADQLAAARRRDAEEGERKRSAQDIADFVARQANERRAREAALWEELTAEAERRGACMQCLSESDWRGDRERAKFVRHRRADFHGGSGQGNRCDHCDKPGVPYTYHGRRFDGLIANRGERLCPSCNDRATTADFNEQDPGYISPQEQAFLARVMGDSPSVAHGTGPTGAAAFSPSPDLNYGTAVKTAHATATEAEQDRATAHARVQEAIETAEGMQALGVDLACLDDQLKLLDLLVVGERALCEVASAAETAAAGLQARHGGTNEAHQAAPVQAAQTEFYD
jgi:hypothetical protein